MTDISRCRHCDGMVATSANTCPHCGGSLPGRSQLYLMIAGFSWGIIILVLMYWAVMHFGL